MIAIVDHGAGNLPSVVNAFEAVGRTPLVTSDPRDLAGASAIVLPGVGAFAEAMTSLHRLGMVETLNEQVLARGKPYLGICLGLQILGREGFEHGTHQGLGWIDGTVRRIAPSGAGYRVPHIGWNDVQIAQPCPLFAGLDASPVFYFVHSFHLDVDGAERGVVTSTCWHGMTVTASVQKRNIFGVQFHPEKSQRDGLRLIENFCRLVEEAGGSLC